MTAGSLVVIASAKPGPIISSAKQSRNVDAELVCIASALRNDLDMDSHSRDANCVRVVHRASPSNRKRAQGMPGEGLTHGPRAVKKHGEGTTGSAGSSGIPCAMVYGLYVISLGTGLSCSHHPRDHLASLTPASGCQDHTTSPSASAPFVRTIARARRQSVHRIPASRVVTIAIRLSDEGGTAPIMLLIWGEVKRVSEKQNASAATEWRDGQFAHGAYARSARRTGRFVGWVSEA
jgi:hypothetical protein